MKEGRKVSQLLFSCARTILGHTDRGAAKIFCCKKREEARFFRLQRVRFVFDMGTKTKPSSSSSSSSSSDTKLTPTETSCSSSFSLEPIAKPKIKWSGDLPAIAPVAPFLVTSSSEERKNSTAATNNNKRKDS
jgi:hypothetical protein